MVVMNFELRRNVFFCGVLFMRTIMWGYLFILLFFEFGKRAIYLGEEFEIESMVQQSVFW